MFQGNVAFLYLYGPLLDVDVVIDGIGDALVQRPLFLRIGNGDADGQQGAKR